MCVCVLERRLLNLTALSSDNGQKMLCVVLYTYRLFFFPFYIQIFDSIVLLNLM